MKVQYPVLRIQIILTRISIHGFINQFDGFSDPSSALWACREKQAVGQKSRHDSYKINVSNCTFISFLSFLYGWLWCFLSTGTKGDFGVFSRKLNRYRYRYLLFATGTVSHCFANRKGGLGSGSTTGPNYSFLSLKNDVNVMVPSKRNKCKNWEKNNFLLASWRSLTKRAGSASGAGSGSSSGSVSHKYGSEDPDPHPDPYQDVTDPEHWCFWRRCCFLYPLDKIFPWILLVSRRSGLHA